MKPPGWTIPDAAIALGIGALVAIAAALEPRSPGGLIALSAAALALAAALIFSPLASAARRRRWRRASEELLSRGLRARSPEDLAEHLATCHRSAFSARAVLIVPGLAGEIVVAAGWDEIAALPEEAAAGLAALRAHGGLARAELSPEMDALAAAAGVDILVPLLHRGTLLGVAGLEQPPRRGLDAYLERVRVYTTLCLARTFLEPSARSRGRRPDHRGNAGEIQRSLLPGEEPVTIDSLRLAGRSRLVRECGGDLWAWSRPAPGQLAVLVADAEGHGSAAAALASGVAGAFAAASALSSSGLDPAAVLAAIGRYVEGAGRFPMAASVAVIDTTSGRARFASAGLPPPMWIAGGRAEPRGGGGELLGVAGGRCVESEAVLGAGEALVLYTDGVLAAGAPVGTSFGERRLAQALARRRGAPVQELCAAVFADVAAFLAGTDPADDLTAVVVTRLEGPA
jgi:hypothetical protein